MAEVGTGRVGRRPATRWFTAAQHTRWDTSRSVWTPVPVGVLHAKCTGTLLTACGQSAEWWPKFLDIPFPVRAAAGSTVCEQCLDLTLESVRTRRAVRA